MPTTLDYQRPPAKRRPAMTTRCGVAIGLMVAGFVVNQLGQSHRNTTSNGLWWVWQWERYVTMFWLTWAGVAIAAYGAVCGLIGCWQSRSARAAIIAGISVLGFLYLLLLQSWM